MSCAKRGAKPNPGQATGVWHVVYLTHRKRRHSSIDHKMLWQLPKDLRIGTSHSPRGMPCASQKRRAPDQTRTHLKLISSAHPRAIGIKQRRQLHHGFAALTKDFDMALQPILDLVGGQEAHRH